MLSAVEPSKKDPSVPAKPDSNGEDIPAGQSDYFDDQGLSAGLTFWRRRIVNGILVTGISLSLFALVPSLILSVQNQFWGLFWLDLIVFTVTIVMFFARRRIDYFYLAAFIVSALYCLGVAVLCYFGFMSGGPAWLFAVPVVAALLLGYRAAVISLILNGITLLFVGWGISKGFFAQGRPFFNSVPHALAVWGNYMLLSVITGLSSAILVQGLEASVAGHRRMMHKYLQEKEALQESESRYRLLTETIRDVIWTMDLDFQITFISPAVENLLGWRVKEIMAKPFSEWVGSQSLKMALEYIRRSLANNRESGDKYFSTTMDLELKHKSGSRVWTEVTISSLVDTNGQISGIVGVARDITDRLAVQQEKERLQEMLNRSRKMEALGLLAGGVAHDLNNVLSGIVSYPDLLLMDLPQDSPLREPLETIKDSGGKAAAIVQDLLTLARRGVVSREFIDLNDLVQQYLESPEYEKLMSSFPNAKVITCLADNLPGIMGSKIHLNKTIMNLVSNAVEALEHKGEVTIATETRHVPQSFEGYQRIEPGRYVVLRVVDQGTGIDAEDLKHIFEPFFTRKKMGRSGTGLGMAVVWGTVQDHEGFIDVKSRPGSGTTIELFFPIHQQDFSRYREDKADDQLDRGLLGAGETVMIVDDMEDQRNICRMILEGLQYTVVTAASGREAVEYLEKKPVDLVILDMIMEPGMDGLETYQAIQKIRPGQKAVIASGFAETDRVRKAMSLGAKAYLKKPYSVKDLAETLRKAFE